MLWHIGNTTVRTPYRLAEALRCLENSPYNGNLGGKEQEHSFAAHLHNQGVVHAPRIIANEDSSDLGRKWRAALMQLGFITPKLSSQFSSNGIDEELLPFIIEGIPLSGRPYEITPNGHRLAHAQALSAQQECFLRSFLSYQIPSQLESNYQGEPFSPIRFVASLIKGLEDCDEEAKLTFQEFALFIQTSTPESGLNSTLNSIVNYRNQRIAAEGNVKAFDREMYSTVAKEVGRADGTLRDYADLTFRYLKASGLFQAAGRGIAFSPAKKSLTLQIIGEGIHSLSEAEYFHSLWKGSRLPTDDLDTAKIVVNELVNELQAQGQDVPGPGDSEDIQDIEQRRHELEDRVFQLDELAYANDQRNQLDEILAWMKAIPSRGSASLQNGERVTIPKGEGPVYLEWILWRAFLAINSLTNTPWEARGFQIDQDFLPVHCAPGGGPDMIFEFEDAVIVVEVTLTASSRQEAAEGEPVRRHVADVAQEYCKDVYGLFIAVTIDSNTAHTFRYGDWYLKDDTKVNLDIVPIALEDFAKLLEAGKDDVSKMPTVIKDVLTDCRSTSSQPAPEWKNSISETVQKYSSELVSS